MNIAQVCTAHGFGHTTRQMALARELSKRGHTTCLFSAAETLLRNEQFELDWHPMKSDVGLVQSDSLTIDLKATQNKLKDLCSAQNRSSMGKQFKDFDLVIVDASPIAMEAAHSQNIPVLAITNFDWAWIYEHYGELSEWAALFRSWQIKHDALYIPPGPGIFYFKSVTQADMLCRTATPHALPSVSILVSFGGFGLHQLENILPQIDGVTWIFAPPNPAPQRADFSYIKNVPYRNLIAGADIVLSKAGYGICTETARSGCHVLLLSRSNFPEAKSLEQFVTNRGGIILPDRRSQPKVQRELIRRAVLEILQRPNPAALGCDGTIQTASLVEQYIGQSFKLNSLNDRV